MHRMVSSREYPDDEALWKALLKGDECAYERLWTLHSDALLAYGLKFTASRDMVKDCVQMVFVRLFMARNRLGSVANIKAYLLRMMKRELINQWEESKRWERSMEERMDFGWETEVAEYQPEGMDDTTYRTHCLLKKALDSLSVRQKEAVYLYYIQEIPLKEIAQLMEIEYQSLRNLMGRAMRALRQHMTQGGVSTLYLLMALKSMGGF